MKHYCRVDKSGQAAVDLSNLTDDQWRCIKTLKTKTLPPMKIVENGMELEREVMHNEITLHDSRLAREFLMSYQKPAEPARDVAPAGTTYNINMPPLELMKVLAFLLTRKPKTVESSAVPVQETNSVVKRP
jgi:hypothetical protein